MTQIAPWSQANATLPNGILVVDDHDLVRLGLRTLVLSHAASTGHSMQVFEACTLQEALHVYRRQQTAIGLVLLDLHLPDAHGLSGLRSFLTHFPPARVVVLSGISDPALMNQAIADGASAYLTKSGNLQDVERYIQTLGVLAQNAPPTRSTSPPDSPRRTGSGPRMVRTAVGEQIHLTARQAEVLDWVLSGQSNRQIADIADLSEGTVKNHVSALLLLFGARSRAQLISQLR